MRVTWSLLALSLFVGCAMSHSGKSSLEPLLPETMPESIRYFHGSWIWPDSIYALQITDSELSIADASKGPPVVHSLSVDDCPQITQGFAVLKEALARSAQIVIGDIAVDPPDEIVMDGPDYRIEYWSRTASTTIILEGGGNAQLVTPWIDAALVVRAIGENCTDI